MYTLDRSAMPTSFRLMYAWLCNMSMLSMEKTLNAPGVSSLSIPSSSLVFTTSLTSRRSQHKPLLQLISKYELVPEYLRD